MIYTPEQIQQQIAAYQGTPLSNPGGTWAAPNTAPLRESDYYPGTEAQTPEAAAHPDWMAAAARYGQSPGAALPQGAGPAAPPPDAQMAPPGAQMAPAETAYAAPEKPQDALRAYAQSSKAEAAAAREQYESHAQSLEAEAALADQQASQLDHQERAASDLRKERDAAAQEAFARFQQANTDAENMRVTSTRSTGQVVLGAITTALAALGDGFNRMGGVTNTNAVGQIQSMIRQQIQDDLERQKEAIADKRKAAAARYSEYGIAREMGLDGEKADQFAISLMQKRHAAEAAALAKRTQSGDAAALAEQTNEHLNAQSDKTQFDMLNEIARTKAYERMAARQGGSRAGGTAGGSINYDPVVIAEKQARHEPLSKDEARILQAYQNSERSGDNQAAKAAADPVQAAREVGAKLSEDLIVTNPEVAPLHSKDPGKMQSQIDSARRMVSAIDELLKIREENPTKFRIPFTDANSAAKSQGTTAQLEAKNVFELGALSGPDMALIENIAGDPTDWSSATDAKLRELRNNTVEGVNSKLVKRGFAPIKLGADKPVPARGSNGTKPPAGASPPPAGKVRVRRKSDGATGTMSADDPALKSGKYEVVQ